MRTGNRPMAKRALTLVASATALVGASAARAQSIDPPPGAGDCPMEQNVDGTVSVLPGYQQLTLDGITPAYNAQDGQPLCRAAPAGVDVAVSPFVALGFALGAYAILPVIPQAWGGNQWGGYGYSGPEWQRNGGQRIVVTHETTISKTNTRFTNTHIINNTYNPAAAAVAAQRRAAAGHGGAAAPGPAIVHHHTGNGLDAAGHNPALQLPPATRPGPGNDFHSRVSGISPAARLPKLQPHAAGGHVTAPAIQPHANLPGIAATRMPAPQAHTPRPPNAHQAAPHAPSFHIPSAMAHPGNPTQFGHWQPQPAPRAQPQHPFRATQPASQYGIYVPHVQPAQPMPHMMAPHAAPPPPRPPRPAQQVNIPRPPSPLIPPHKR